MSSPNIVRISPKLLRPRIPELGKIKIGAKGEARQKRGGGGTYRLPTKLTHFIVTRRTRDAADDLERDKVVHDAVGSKPTELDVRLMFDDPAANFQSFLAAYDGMTKRCSGDGDKAYDIEHGEIACTCPWLKQHTGKYEGPERPAKLNNRPIACKPHGRLSVILEAAATYGGFYVFRTTSWETISSIAGQLETFSSQFGYLAGLPLRLVMYPTEDRYVENGREKKSKSFKVALVLRASFDAAYQLAAAAHERRQSLQLPAGRDVAAQHMEQLREAEERDAAEIAAEFHPPETSGDDDDPDYEVVTEEEEEQAEEESAARDLESLCRFALELADWEPAAINKQVAKYTANLDQLVEFIKRDLPSQWEQANKARAESKDAAEADKKASDATSQPELLS